jgi:hypothetical protein
VKNLFRKFNFYMFISVILFGSFTLNAILFRTFVKLGCKYYSKSVISVLVVPKGLRIGMLRIGMFISIRMKPVRDC